jgi:DUF2935 family protein
MSLDPLGDMQFWGNQIREHMLFLKLLLVDGSYKNEAATFETRWTTALAQVQATKNVNVVRNLLDETIEYKRELLSQLKQGKWLGWAYPSLVDHILQEAEFLRQRVWGPVPDAQRVYDLSLKLSGDHALLIVHLLDLGEGKLVAEGTQQASELYDLREANSPQEAMAAERDLAIWIRAQNIGYGKTSPLSIVPQVLSDHIIREQLRFVSMTGDLKLPQ